MMNLYGNDFDRLFPGLRMKPETMSEIEAKMPQYLFYEPVGRSGKKLCKCTSCGNSGVFKIDGKHRSNIICPMCMDPVTMIAHRKLSNHPDSLESWIPVVWFQAKGDALCAVGARVTRRFYRESWDGPDWYSDLRISPFEVYEFSPGKAEEWKFGWCRVQGRWDYGWSLLKRPKEPIQRGGSYGTGPYKYYLWQTEEIEKTSVRYSAVDLYMEDPVEDRAEVYGIIKYLTAYCEQPKLELVCKWGLWDVANDLVWDRKNNGRTVNWKGNTPWEFLRITKEDWKAYRNSGVVCVSLLGANRRTFHMKVYDLLMLVRDHGNPNHWLAEAEKICKKGITLKQAVKYIEKQNALRANHRGLVNWFYFWSDYLNMAEKCGRDVSTMGAIMPRELQQAHDDMADLQRAMRDEIAAKEIAEKTERYAKRTEMLEKKYAYQSGELMIRVPKSGAEIVEEGNVLKICVGGYAARHLEGSITILFLRRRRKPDTPYICIELDKQNNIRQIHGYRNEHVGGKKQPQDPAKKFEPFLKEWLAWVAAGSHRNKTEKKQEVSA